MRRAAAWAAVVALALLSIVPAPYATLWPDTVRDVAASLAFARGEGLPLVGPTMNFGPYLGPIWIWLQAIPLAIAPSLAATSLFVAAIAALKFPLLFFTGRTLAGDRMGLAFVAASAFPSIAVYQWMVFFHPSWVEAAITLVLLLAAIAMKRRSLPLAYASAAALGFALQMHPTSLFYAPFVAAAFFAAGARGARLLAHLAGASLLALLWFAPVLFASDLGQAQKASGVASRMGASLATFSPADALVVLRSAYIEVPRAVGETYSAALGIPVALWNAALAIAGLAAVAGLGLALSARAPWRWTLAALALLLVAGWLGITAIRGYTGFHICYFLLPLSAIVFGAGLERLAASPQPILRWWGFTAIGLAMACFVVSAVGARAVGRSAAMESRLPALSNLRNPDLVMRVGFTTAAARDAAARHLCRHSPMPVLHGELAFALAASTGLDMQLRCPGRAAELRILGAEAGRGALATMPVAHAKALSRAPAEHFRGIAAFPAKAIHPAAARPIETDWYYFERLRDRKPIERVVLEFTTGPATHVVVYRMKPFHSAWRDLRVTRNDAPAAAALSTYNSDVFASEAAATRWRVEFETDAPHWVDVHAF